MSNILDIPYQFIEEITDLLTEYEDQKMIISFYIIPYGKEKYNHLIYVYSYNFKEVIINEYYTKSFDDFIELYKENNVPLNKFVYYININNDDIELTSKFVNRLKQIYPNIKTDISSYDVRWYKCRPNYKLNDDPLGIYFILE